MATVVNIVPRDPFAGMGEALQRASELYAAQSLSKQLLDTKLAAQAKLAADTEATRTANEIKLINFKVRANREAREQEEDVLAQLLKDSDSPAPSTTVKESASEFGVPQFTAQTVTPGTEIPSGEGLMRPEFMNTAEGAKRKLGAKGFTTDPRFPGVPVKPSTVIELEKVEASKSAAASKASGEFIKLQKALLEFKSAKEKAIVKTNTIELGKQAIIRGKLFQAEISKMSKEDRSTAPEKIASWLADKDPALLTAIISGEGSRAWIKKDALESGVTSTSFVPIGSPNAVPISKFTKLYTDIQGGIPEAIKTERIRFEGWAVGKGVASSPAEFEKRYPVGSEAYNRFKGWHQYMLDIKDHTDVAFRSGQVKIDGWNQIPGLDETAFGIQFQGAMLEVLDLISERKYEDGIEIPDAEILGNNIMTIMHNGLSDAFTKNTDKAKRRSAVKAFLAPKNIKGILIDAAGQLSDVSQSTVLTAMADKYGEKTVDIKTPGTWQDVLAFAAQEKPGIFDNPDDPNMAVYEDNLVKHFPEEESRIRAVFQNPKAIRLIIQTPQGR